MGSLQEVEYVFLKVRASIDLGFVQKRRCAMRLDFPRDLLGNPRISPAVADEDQSLCRVRRFIGHSKYCTNRNIDRIPTSRKRVLKRLGDSRVSASLNAP